MTSRYRLGMILALVTMLLTSVVLIPQSSTAQRQPSISTPSQQSLISDLQTASAGQATIAYHAETGVVRFIGTDAQHAIARPAALKAPASSEQAAMQFAQTYGSLFGLQDPANELTVNRTEKTPDGRQFVRYQQVHNGVPVLGGDLIVQTNHNGALLSMAGEALPQLSIDTTPKVDAAAALDAARSTIAKSYNVTGDNVAFSTPELWIYNSMLLGGPGMRQNTLVWRTEATSESGAQPIRELILIDAQRGSTALHFNQIAHAKERYVCNAQNVADNDGNPNNNCDQQGEVVRSEGQGAVGNADVDLAYEYSGITYDFYANLFGRNSIDNAGMQLISLANYCPQSMNCVQSPFQNAYWNGRQMTYGKGYAAADDVVGHELAHGVTEYTAGLFYYYQSGAINESMSDVFGELIDLAAGYGAGHGNDSSTSRWLIGEDLPIGAIRDMENPGAFSNPDRTSSSDYHGDPSDSGGVHYNSGVNNKAAFLLVDGGSFNGRTIAPLGIFKTAHIYYETLAHLLTSASDYQDLYNALQQGCASLIGQFGITSNDCVQVKNAVMATEMHIKPNNAPTEDAPVCTVANTYPIYSFFDNMENPAAGNWTKITGAGVNDWYVSSLDTVYGSFKYATSGKVSLWGNDQGGTQANPLTPADYSIAMSKSIVVPNNAFLRFNHSFGFEADGFFFRNYYDGGVIEYSTNNGASWQDAGSLIDGGLEYGGTLETGENPLAEKEAFVDHSNGYGSSRLDLSSLAGQSVRFRFRIGTDSQVDEYGWFIDDLGIYRCGQLNKKVYVPMVTR